MYRVCSKSIIKTLERSIANFEPTQKLNQAFLLLSLNM